MTNQKKKRKPNKNWFIKKEKPTRAEMKPWGDLLEDKLKENEKKRIKVDEVPF